MITPFTSQNADLLVGVDKSNLKLDAYNGDGTFDVYSISKFAVDNILCIGELGDEGSEIARVHASTAPSGYTVSLHSALTKDHPKDTPVYIISYDQVEFSYSATETGTKSVRSTQTIDSEREGNLWNETTYTTGYIFTRFLNSVSGAYSNYSDPFPFTGQEMNTVGYLIEDASEDVDPEGKVPFERKIRTINKGLRYIRGKLKRWNTFQEFDYKLDQTERGKYLYTMPTTIYDTNSNKSVLDVRIGGDDKRLAYRDKREFVDLMDDAVTTTVATAPTVGQTTLVLTNSYDFPSSGTVNIYYNGTLYDVTYTGNTVASGTLTGIAASGDGSIEAAFPAGTNVWYSENEGEPDYYSVWDGNLAIWPLPDSTYDDKNIIMDFYTDIVEVDSEGDTIGIHRYDMLYYYLKWELRNITERNGKKDYTDGDWMMFKEILADAIRKETSGQKFKWQIKVRRITDSRGGGLPFDRA